MVGHSENQQFHNYLARIEEQLEVAVANIAEKLANSGPRLDDEALCRILMHSIVEVVATDDGDVETSIFRDQIGAFVRIAAQLRARKIMRLQLLESMQSGVPN